MPLRLAWLGLFLAACSLDRTGTGPEAGLPDAEVDAADDADAGRIDARADGNDADARDGSDGRDADAADGNDGDAAVDADTSIDVDADADADASEDADADAPEDADADAPDPCTPSPCVHGMCNGVTGTAYCMCDAGYGGSLCEIDIDDCAPAPCLNGGTCTDGVASYACSCPSGFGGARCEYRSLVAPTGRTNLSFTNTGGRVCADGGDMVAYSVTGLTATTATFDQTVSSGCLVAGDHIVLINLRGTSAANVNVGQWEPLLVESVSGSTITFAGSKTLFYGSGATDDANIGVGATSQRVNVVRVPQYFDVTIPASSELVAAQWDGARGGVFTFEAWGTVTGRITMSGRGYVGGAATTTTNTTGQQGESMFGLGRRLQVANHAGGGGGLGDGAGCQTYGTAGGGGGSLLAGTRASVSCGGNEGAAYDASFAFPRVVMGGGGGSGGTDNVLTDNPRGGSGGDGGGIILVRATIVGASTYSANGARGEGDTVADCMGLSRTSTMSCWDYSGPGGGGGGGSVYVFYQTMLVAPTVEVNGGAGGSGYSTLAGNGGAGAAGRSGTSPVP